MVLSVSFHLIKKIECILNNIISYSFKKLNSIKYF